MLCSDCGSDVCSADLLLQDATRGLLAPNNASGAGAGFVSYSVRPSDDVATGAGISASARVLMDGFAPEDTLVLSQTVEVDAPENPLPAARIAGTPDYRVELRVADDEGEPCMRPLTPLYPVETENV